MALGYKFCSQCSHENFKHGCRSQEAAAVPYIFPSLFLSGAAHLGCYESNRCDRDGVPTLPPITVILPFLVLDCHSCLFWFELQLQKLLQCCLCAVCLSHCLCLLPFTLPILSPCLTLAATVPLPVSWSLFYSEFTMLSTPVNAGKSKLSGKIQD